MRQEHTDPIAILDVPDWSGETPTDSWALVSQRDPLVLTNEHGKVGWSPSRSKAWLLPFNQALAHARDTSFSWELLMLVADWTSSKNLDD